MKLVLVLNLPYVIHKNLNQVLALTAYDFLFITKEKRIQDTQCPENCQQKPIRNPFVRLFYCLLFLLVNKKKIHHVEIYPGGKLTFIFSLYFQCLSGISSIRLFNKNFRPFLFFAEIIKVFEKFICEFRISEYFSILSFETRSILFKTK